MKMNISEKHISRFFKRIEKTDSCWLWTGGNGTRGYGAFRVGLKTIGAHRFSYMFHIGNIPNGLIVCHTCDTPACVNPGHLFLGTHMDNFLDSKMKGRRGVRKGKEHPSMSFYEKGCRCIECWTLFREYQNNYTKKRKAEGKPSYYMLRKLKAGLLLLMVFCLIGCTKPKEENRNTCATIITYAKGVEVKRITVRWYENQKLGSDTIRCGEYEIVVTIFHKCK